MSDIELELKRIDLLLENLEFLHFLKKMIPSLHMFFPKSKVIGKLDKNTNELIDKIREMCYVKQKVTNESAHVTHDPISGPRLEG